MHVTTWLSFVDNRKPKVKYTFAIRVQALPVWHNFCHHEGLWPSRVQSVRVQKQISDLSDWKHKSTRSSGARTLSAHGQGV